jgi:chromosome segregation ATPase
MQFDIMENLRAQLAEVTRERDALKLDLLDAEGRYEMECEMRHKAEARVESIQSDLALCYESRDQLKSQLAIMDQMATSKNELVKQVERLETLRTLDRAEYKMLRADLRSQVAILEAELEQVCSHGGGCCDHACLVDPPKVGTTGGKCYCSQGRVRKHISDLTHKLAQADHHLCLCEVDRDAYLAERNEALAQVESLKADLVDAKQSAVNFVDAHHDAQVENSRLKAQVERLRAALSDILRHETPGMHTIVGAMASKALAPEEHTKHCQLLMLRDHPCSCGEGK